jgi:prepilin-type N-terminal cleavage/methylation domain-containing protein
MKKNRGFTLIELIIVIVLLGIISVIATKMLAQGFNAYLTGKNILNADWQGRLAMERMVRDIRAIRSPTAGITTATATQLAFTDTNGTDIVYQVSGSNLMRNSQVLADGVQSITFSYFNQNGATTGVLSAIDYITIILNITQNNTTFSLTTSVNARNVS